MTTSPKVLQFGYLLLYFVNFIILRVAHLLTYHYLYCHEIQGARENRHPRRNLKLETWNFRFSKLIQNCYSVLLEKLE